MDLFVLDTPLQLLNAIEARHYFGDRPSALVMPHWPHWPKITFNSLLNVMEWQEIVWIPMGARRTFRRYPMIGQGVADRLNEYVWTYRQYRRRRRFDKVLAQFDRVDRLVVGNLSNGYMRHVVARVPPTEVWAVDDGTDTLRVSALRRIPAQPSEKPASFIKSAKRFIRKRYIEWDCRQPEAVNFFTAYDIDVGPNDRLIRNDYRWLRGRAASSKSNGLIYFLGQPLIEDGYLDESTYLLYLERVARHFGERAVIYIPHKRETARTVTLVERDLGLVIKSFDDPIEVVLSLGGELPHVLASFFCSALENCAILFGSSLKVMAFYLPPQVLQDSDRAVENMYKYFRRRQTDYFQVVETQANMADSRDGHQPLQEYPAAQGAH